MAKDAGKKTTKAAPRSAENDRARARLHKLVSPAKAKAKTVAAGSAPRADRAAPIGRPPNTPDKWTPEYIALVVEDMERYVASVPYPTEAEFCYTRHIHPQRLSECEELRNARVMLFAKRQASIMKRGMELGPKEGPLCSFMLRLAANAGPFSMHEKTDLSHSGSLGVVILDDIPAKKE